MKNQGLTGAAANLISIKSRETAALKCLCAPIFHRPIFERPHLYMTGFSLGLRRGKGFWPILALALNPREEPKKNEGLPPTPKICPIYKLLPRWSNWICKLKHWSRKDKFVCPKFSYLAMAFVSSPLHRVLTRVPLCLAIGNFHHVM